MGTARNEDVSIKVDTIEQPSQLLFFCGFLGDLVKNGESDVVKTNYTANWDRICDAAEMP